MLLARIWEIVFDQDERKKKMELAKRQAMERIQVPPLNGLHSKSGESVPLSEVITSGDQYWLNLFLQSESIRKRYGVETVEGKWKIVNQDLFNAKVDEAKRFLLRPHWKK